MPIFNRRLIDVRERLLGDFMRGRALHASGLPGCSRRKTLHVAIISPRRRRRFSRMRAGRNSAGKSASICGACPTVFSCSRVLPHSRQRAGYSRIIGEPREAESLARVLSCHAEGVTDLMLQKRDARRNFSARGEKSALAQPVYRWTLEGKIVRGEELRVAPEEAIPSLRASSHETLHPPQLVLHRAWRGVPDWLRACSVDAAGRRPLPR